MQDEVKRFLGDPDRGRPKQQRAVAASEENSTGATLVAQESYIDRERHSDLAAESVDGAQGEDERGQQAASAERTVDVVLSDMSEPWPQTSGFWKKSLSNPYRMMNTSGILFRDHAGSMVSHAV